MDLPQSTGPIIDTPSPLAIAAGPGVNGVWVEAVPQLVTSPLLEWANTAKVAAVKIPGYWIHRAGSNLSVGDPPMPDEKVVYSIMVVPTHINQSAHPSDLIASISRGILEHTESIQRVFSIEYRLSGAASFPAALLDSAGANFAHALARYLVERRDDTKDFSKHLPRLLCIISYCGLLMLSHLAPNICPNASHDAKSQTN